MEGILTSFVLITGIIVFASILNEKKLHLPHDIALLGFSVLLGVAILGLQKTGILSAGDELVGAIQNTKLDSFLLECTLGFMMFASASKLHFTKFIKNILPIRCTFNNIHFSKFDNLWFLIFLCRNCFKI